VLAQCGSGRVLTDVSEETFFLTVSNLTQFVNHLRVILGHIRPKYVIIIDNYSWNLKIQYSLVTKTGTDCNCIGHLEKARCAPLTVWKLLPLRVIDFVEFDILRNELFCINNWKIKYLKL
jgi:hypothetical protein